MLQKTKMITDVNLILNVNGTDQNPEGRMIKLNFIFLISPLYWVSKENVVQWWSNFLVVMVTYET